MGSSPPERHAPPEEGGARPLSFLAAAGWTIAVGILYSLVVQISDAARPGAVGDLVTHTAASVLAYSVVFFAMLRVHEPGASIRHALALRRPPILALLLAPLIGVGLALPADWLERVMSERMPATPKELELIERLYAAPTMGKRLLLIVLLAVVGPIVDELFFRGALFTALKPGRRLQSVIAAAAAYEALLYLDPRKMVSFFAAVLVFSWMRGMTGSIFPSIVARIAFSVVDTLPLVTGNEAKPSRSIVAAGSALAVALLVALAAVCRRDARAAQARLEDG